MTCHAHLHDGPLRCVRPLGHAHSHVFHATAVPQDHSTEARQED